MSSLNCFNPDWVSPPADTILELLSDKSYAGSDLCRLMNIAQNQAELLLKGQLEIDLSIAKILSSTLGASENFWLQRQHQYNEANQRLVHEQQEWLTSLPLKELVKNGFLAKCLNHNEKFNACLRFFGVDSLNQWESTYHKKLSIASFRTSESFDSNPTSVITWLRMGEVLAEKSVCNKWDKDLLVKELPNIRALSRDSELSRMLPNLRELLLKCGVALAIVKTPAGCRASGATYFLSENKAIIILSFRYLSDDHFWFSLFHEIGHLLLHGMKGLFLEGLGGSTSKEELEADSFAEEILIPQKYKAQMQSFRVADWKKIIRFAKEVGVSKGIVVGQLQHAKIISYSSLNKMKVRYKWGS